jgi:pimeloyl-ACP methyl ester carboxylesterase
MEPLFEHRLSLAGYETRALELEGSGPPLLLLHGFADSADTWRHLLATLGRAGRRALAVDLPGFGTADALTKDAILPQLDAFADALLAYALADSRAREAVLVGNSLGGCVGLRLAERAGARLGGLVAVAPAGLAMSRWVTIVERDPVLRTLLALPFPVPRPLVREALGMTYGRFAFAHPGRIDRRVFDLFCSHHSDRAAVARVLSLAHRIVPELHDPFELERIGCPVLLVWGEKDRLVFPVGAERVLEAVPGSRLEVIDDCGHCPQIECPDRLAELVLAFPGALAQAP